jgi:hypothetical protein
MKATLQILFSFRGCSRIFDVCESPSKCSVPFIKEAALTAIADRAALQVIIQALVDRTIQQRRKKTNKNLGQARVLSVEETKEAADEAIKARNKALRGKVGFAKLV